MKPPPHVAKWLLGVLAPSTPDWVFGDLQEEYEQGRSTGWYWRQAFRAIVAATTRQITAHPVLTLRAVFVGWAFVWIFFEYCFQLFLSPTEWLFVRGIADIRSWWPSMPTTLLRHVIGPLACIAAGWIVARFHKREMVLVFVMAIFAWSLMGVIHAFSQGRLQESLLNAIVVNFVVVPVSILVGGLLTARTEAIE